MGRKRSEGPFRRSRPLGRAGVRVAVAGGWLIAGISLGVGTPVSTGIDAIHASAPRPVPVVSEAAVGLHAVIPQFPPPIGVTSLLSLDTKGSPSNGGSVNAAISADGKVVAFVSIASDLVANDDNGMRDIFRRDRTSGITTRLPLPSGVPQFGLVKEPTVSKDGSVIAFTYELPDPDSAGQSVVMAWDKKTGGTKIVSRHTDDKPDFRSHLPSISGDGSLIAYATSTEVMRGDTNRVDDVVVVNREKHVPLWVASIGPNNVTGAGESTNPAISLDGKSVAFESDAALVPEDSNGVRDVYVRRLAARTPELVSVGPDNGLADGASSSPAISERGDSVAFLSAATNLTQGDGNGVTDVFWRDLREGNTLLVSENASHGPANSNSIQPAISGDGRIVSFASAATNLLAGSPRNPGAGLSEIYAFDVRTRETILVSEAAAGGPAGQGNQGPAIGDQGRVIAFASDSPLLVNGDANNAPDVFLREFGAAPVLTPASLDFVVLPTGGKVPPQEITFANAGWGPVRVTGANIKIGASTFELAKNGCANVVLHRDDRCTISVIVPPGGSDATEGTLRITNDCTIEATTIPLRVITSPILEIEPLVARPGDVVMAVGAGFPAGTYALTWDRGITAAQIPVSVDASGSFRVQVLVFHNDILGVRRLIATKPNGSTFEPVSADLLVTDPPAIPPSYAARAFRINANRSLIARH